MKKQDVQWSWLLLVGLLAFGGIMGCNKKTDSTAANSGGGVSSQSVVTITGAGQ